MVAPSGLLYLQNKIHKNCEALHVLMGTEKGKTWVFYSAGQASESYI